MNHPAFDLALVVSVASNQERRAYIKTTMAQEKVDFEFVDAICPEPGSIRYDEIREMDFYGGKWETFRSERYVLGAVGCRRSHTVALRVALQRQARAVAIFEDDIIFAPNWRPTLAAAHTQLPSNWYQLYLGGQIFGRVLKIGSHLAKVENLWTTHAIIYSAAALRPAIELLETTSMEADVALARKMQTLGRSYLAQPMLVMQERHPSQIGSSTAMPELPRMTPRNAQNNSFV
jgi:GR25 family glycosyltransferase involved in LPS biosynthesis